LIGAGQRAFTAGADISGDLSAGPEVARMVNHALLKNGAYSKPIVAAVNGDCVGGGIELLLSTDIRAAVPEARFGLPEVKWSICSHPAMHKTCLSRQIERNHINVDWRRRL
jgi:enoyl-CoA hydratase/carnithine racemase